MVSSRRFPNLPRLALAGTTTCHVTRSSRPLARSTRAWRPGCPYARSAKRTASSSAVQRCSIVRVPMSPGSLPIVGKVMVARPSPRNTSRKPYANARAQSLASSRCTLCASGVSGLPSAGSWRRLASIWFRCCLLACENAVSELTGSTRHVPMTYSSIGTGGSPPHAARTQHTIPTYTALMSIRPS